MPIVLAKEIELIETQSYCGLASGRQGLRETAGSRGGRESLRLDKTVGVDKRSRGCQIDLRRAVERHQRPRVARQLAIQLSAPSINANREFVAARVVRQSVGDLVSIVHASLRKIENVNAHRT